MKLKMRERKSKRNKKKMKERKSERRENKSEVRSVDDGLSPLLRFDDVPGMEGLGGNYQSKQ